jgi:hypothetical protein
MLFHNHVIISIENRSLDYFEKKDVIFPLYFTLYQTISTFNQLNFLFPRGTITKLLPASDHVFLNQKQI